MEKGQAIVKTIIVESFANVDFSKLFMPVIVVYENPKDYPGRFVARLFDLDKPTRVAVVKETLDEVRKAIPRSMVSIVRSKFDDPAIFEIWI